MLIYRNSGFVDYEKAPVRVYSRPAWEFSACLNGEMMASMQPPGLDEVRRSRTLWVFPKVFPHGWTGQDEVERVVFHHTVVPDELVKKLPPRGYYRVSLSAADCDGLRSLAGRALEMTVRPTELLPLETRTLVAELSLIALREANPHPLSASSKAYSRTERAISWYREHISETPGFNQVARAVYVSPAHLRRIFHEARGESPQQVFKRLRMEMATDLLQDSNKTLDEIAALIGFSSASALSRAIKANFGIPPVALRKQAARR